MTFNPKYIILHHSKTKDGKTVSWDDIERYHKSWAYKGNIITENQAQNLYNQGISNIKTPWNDTGYHAGIELIDDRYLLMIGRMWDKQGAHCKKMNSKSLGLCFVGDYDNVEPTPQMIEKGIYLIKYWMELFNIPIKNVKGHCEFANKTCPGKKFQLNALKAMLG